MEADKNEWKTLKRALDDWEHSGKLTPAQAAELRKTISLKRTERQQIAQYFFFIALCCTLLAFGALFLNDKLLEKIKHYFSWSDLSIALIAYLLAGTWLWYTGRKRTRINPGVYEIYMVLGALTALTALIYTCKYLGIDKTYTAFLGMATPTLAILGVAFRARAIWVGAVIAAMAWFGSVTSWLGHNNQFLGLNYPMRFTLFGLVLLGVAWMQGRVAALKFSAHITYVSGLLLFFTALWFVSIFGNYNTITGWQQVRQVRVMPYAILFGLSSALSFYLGVRFRDDLAKDVGVLFLLINLYTRYFEYFWDAMNKGLFFIVLALTFGVLGRWLERKKRTGKFGL